MAKSRLIRMGRNTIEADNLDKVFFPEAGLTKGDLLEYYKRIADTMLPYVRDRAVSMQRFPDGISGEGFYHKETPDYFPDWVSRRKLPNRDGGDTTYVVIDKAATLVYLADQGTITPHVWLSRVDRPENPDRLIFDLDPFGHDFEPVRKAAREIRRVLDDVGVVWFVMTTGSRGFHIVVPLDRAADFEQSRTFARDVARLAAARNPEELTTEQRRVKRGERVFLDVMRNAYGQTGAPPYAVRPRPGAPVAAPLDWNEIGDSDLRPNSYTIENIFRRLGQMGDPWKGMTHHARSLGEPSRRLKKLLERKSPGPEAGS
jgi:bifunctional non-homologous end joining protein LigD